MVKRFGILALCALTAAALATTAATSVQAGKPAPPPSVATANWTGNGTWIDGTTRALDTATCASSNDSYLLWVLSGSKATSARITIGSSGTFDMGKPNIDKKGYSTFKYEWNPSGEIDLDNLFTTGVSAVYNDARNKATLTVSHGCTGIVAAICSAKPSSSGNPVISNTGGDNYSTTNGTWDVLPGCTNTYTYAWIIGEGQVAGTNQTITADGTMCSFIMEVTATNQFGSTTISSSEVSTGLCTTATCTSAPSNTGLPLITNTSGNNYSTSDGTWDALPGCTNTFTYAWIIGEGEPAGTAKTITADGTMCSLTTEVTATNESGLSTTVTSSNTVDTGLCGV